MKTVHEVSELSGLTIRALRHYDDIGLLKVERTGEGVSNDRKLYSDEDIEKLFTIMIYKELDVPLKEIKKILNAPGFDRLEALGEQINKLKAKRRHLSNIITCAEFVFTYGTELLSGEDFSPEGIDTFAKKIRSSKHYKDARKKLTMMDKGQLDEIANRLEKHIGALAGLNDESDYESIASEVDAFTNSFAEISDLEPSAGIKASLAYLFLSNDSAFSVIADKAGGENAHETVMMAILLVCAKEWGASLTPLGRAIIATPNDAKLVDRFWKAMEKSIGSDLQEDLTPQEFFDYAWICFGLAMLLLEDQGVRDELSLNDESYLNADELNELCRITAEHLGLEANIDMEGDSK